MAQYTECPDCHSKLDHGEACDCQKPAPQPESEAPPEQPNVPACKGCGKSLMDVPAYIEMAEAQKKDILDFIAEDPCYNPTAALFLCPDCWNAAGQPTEMVQPTIRCKFCGRQPHETDDDCDEDWIRDMDCTYNPSCGLYCCWECWEDNGLM